MKKILYDFRDGIVSTVLDYKETNKRFKIVFPDGSYSLIKKDSNAAKRYVLIECADSEDINKKIEECVVNYIHNTFNKILASINFDEVFSILIEGGPTFCNIKWVSNDVSCTMSTETIYFNIKDGAKIIDDLIKKHIASKKCIYKKKYRSSRALLCEEIKNPWITNSGLYINKKIFDKLPKEMVVGRTYTIETITPLCEISVYVPSEFYSDIFSSPASTDMRCIPFSIDEINNINKDIKVLFKDNSNDNESTKIHAILNIKNVMILCTKTDNADEKYNYINIGRSTMFFKFIDEIAKFKNEKSTFKFLAPVIGVNFYMSKDFIFDELIIKSYNMSAMREFLGFNSNSAWEKAVGYSPTLLLSPISLILPTFLSDLKKFLGSKYETWRLMCEVSK